MEHGVYSDPLGAAMDEIDWDEIARHYWEGSLGQEPVTQSREETEETFKLSKGGDKMSTQKRTESRLSQFTKQAAQRGVPLTQVLLESRLGLQKQSKKQKMTDKELRESKEIAEGLKKHPDKVKNPHALARWIAQQKGQRGEATKKESALEKQAFIRKTPGKDEWCVYSHQNKKKLGCYDSMKAAKERLGQIAAFKGKQGAAMPFLNKPPQDTPTVPKPATPAGPGMIWVWNPQSATWVAMPQPAGGITPTASFKLS